MIKFLVMDVDGSLTDGKIYMGSHGELFKAFDIKDGCGIKDILPQHRVEPVIITARKSEMLEQRCKELGIVNLFQNVKNKREKLDEMLNTREKDHYSLQDCAYFGDDLLDIDIMNSIKAAGGVVGCPADAVCSVKALANYVCVNKAGAGAAREFIEWLVEPKIDEKILEKRICDAKEYLSNIDVTSFEKNVRYSENDDFSFVIQEYETKTQDKCQLESHRRYIDIQIIVSGQEMMDIVDVSRLTPRTEYDSQGDIIYWNAPKRMARTTLAQGDCIILYPENAHRGAIAKDASSRVIKIVGKIKVN